jgi:hypothetical protein
VAKKGFREFRELSRTSPTIRQALDAAGSETEFAALAVKVGADAGYTLTQEEVLAWNRERGSSLSEEQLDAVVGGVLIGGGAKQEKKTFADYWYAIFYA